VTNNIKPGRLVWVPDDGERGIVLALSEDKRDVLVCFAAWKNGAETTVISEENAMLFVPPRGSLRAEASKVGWASPFLLPKGTFIAWYAIEDCEFDHAPLYDDRAGWCEEAYPEDARLTRRD
jgi:hypothetical protein